MKKHKARILRGRITQGLVRRGAQCSGASVLASGEPHEPARTLHLLRRFAIRQSYRLFVRFRAHKFLLRLVLVPNESLVIGSRPLSSLLPGVFSHAYIYKYDSGSRSSHYMELCLRVLRLIWLLTCFDGRRLELLLLLQTELQQKAALPPGTTALRKHQTQALYNTHVLLYQVQNEQTQRRNSPRTCHVPYRYKPQRGRRSCRLHVYYCRYPNCQ